MRKNIVRLWRRSPTDSAYFKSPVARAPAHVDSHRKQWAHLVPVIDEMYIYVIVVYSQIGPARRCPSKA